MHDSVYKLQSVMEFRWCLTQKGLAQLRDLEPKLPITVIQALCEHLSNSTVMHTPQKLKQNMDIRTDFHSLRCALETILPRI
jgi:hypothetical protein